MTPARADRRAAAVAIGLALLTLPFHPLWIDFEAVRRGLLSVLCGAAMLAWRLPSANGARVANCFVGLLIIDTGVHWLADHWFRGDAEQGSFQPWEATARIAQWATLLVLPRIGAAIDRSRLGTPLAAMLAAIALFGLLQRLGLAEITGYGVEREPVGTFGNLNVASEWTAIAATAVAVLWPTAARGPLRWLAPGALVLAGAYLVANGSRSGMIALPIALLLLGLLRRREGGFRALPLVLAGGLFGVGVAAAAAPPTAVDARAQQTALQRGTKTLAVRFEIARGATRLFAASPVLGHGPGQFQVQYPRVRSDAEIELSSHGRAFATEVRSAHDDWLELLVDGGLPALAVFAALLFALQRGVRDKARLLPLFVLLLLMLVRAPIGNAPAAALAFLLAGTAVDGDSPTRRWRRPLAVLLGAVLVAFGSLPVIAHTLFVPYLRARLAGELPPLDAVQRAARWMWWEPAFLELEAGERLQSGDLPGAAATAACAVRLRPFAPQLRLLLAEALARGNRYAEALQVAGTGLEIDPVHPELRTLRSTALAQLGEVDRAIEAVAVDPHPQLRANLAKHFEQLSDLAERRGAAVEAARYAVESDCLELIARFGADDVEALAEAGVYWRAFVSALQDCGRSETDARYPVIGALRAHELGKPELAERLAVKARDGGLRLTPWQRALFGDKLAPLRAEPAWAPILGG